MEVMTIEDTMLNRQENIVPYSLWDLFQNDYDKIFEEVILFTMDWKDTVVLLSKAYMHIATRKNDFRTSDNISSQVRLTMRNALTHYERSFEREHHKSQIKIGVPPRRLRNRTETTPYAYEQFCRSQGFSFLTEMEYFSEPEVKIFLRLMFGKEDLEALSSKLGITPAEMISIRDKILERLLRIFDTRFVVFLFMYISDNMDVFGLEKYPEESF